MAGDVIEISLMDRGEHQRHRHQVREHQGLQGVVGGARGGHPAGPGLPLVPLDPEFPPVHWAQPQQLETVVLPLLLNDLGVEEGDGRLFLVETDGQIAGTISLRKIRRNCGEIKRMYVRPQFRGKKIGTLMIDEVIKV